MAQQFYNLVLLGLPAISSTIALLICLAAWPIGTRLQLIDQPGGRKSHKKSTPLMGGVVLMIAYLPLIAFWSFMAKSEVRDVVGVIAACTAALTVLGLVDDRKHLSASVRLLICFVVISLGVWWNPDLAIQAISWNAGSGSVQLGRWGAVATVVCVVSLIQAANMADGKNGLLIGLCIAWLWLLYDPLSVEAETPVSILLFVLGVLLAFNLASKLFLGDGGSYGLATFIGLIAAYCSNSGASVSADRLGLIFLLPVIDMIRLLVVRTLRGQAPTVGDRDHLHHHLLRAFGWPGGLVVYLMGSVLPSVIAANAPRLTLLVVASTFVGYFGLIYYARRFGDARAARMSQ